MNSSIYMDWFGGFPLDTLIPMGSGNFEVISLILYGRWLVLIGAFLLMVGCCPERRDKIERLACYRYGAAVKWWRNRFWKGLLSGTQKAVCLMLVFLVCDLVMGRAHFLLEFGEEAAKIGGLWLVHVISLNALFLLLDLGGLKHYVPAAVLLIEGITFYMGYRISAITNIMYGTWGMYLRSDWFDARGFSAERVLAAELFLLAAGYYTGKLYLKRNGICKGLGKDGF